MANFGFCGKCGSPLSKNGKCPNCDRPQQVAPQPPKQPKKKNTEKQNNKTQKQRSKNAPPSKGQNAKGIIIRILIVVAILAIFACAAIGTLVYFDTVKIPFVNKILVSTGIKSGDVNEMGTNTTEEGSEADADMSQPYKVPYENAEELLNENGTVSEKTAAKDAKDVLTEAEIYKDFEARGFTQNAITSNYTMEGEYTDAAEISKDGKDQHPIYRTYYTAKNGNLWSIMQVNGIVMATPLTGTDESASTEAPIVLSESDYLISYDNVTNTFYKMTPDEAQMDIKKVEKIDAKTLDAYK